MLQNNKDRQTLNLAKLKNLSLVSFGILFIVAISFSYLIYRRINLAIELADDMFVLKSNINITTIDFVEYDKLGKNLLKRKSIGNLAVGNPFAEKNTTTSTANPVLH